MQYKVIKSLADSFFDSIKNVLESKARMYNMYLKHLYLQSKTASFCKNQSVKISKKFEKIQKGLLFNFFKKSTNKF